MSPGFVRSSEFNPSYSSKGSFVVLTLVKRPSVFPFPIASAWALNNFFCRSDKHTGSVDSPSEGTAVQCARLWHGKLHYLSLKVIQSLSFQKGLDQSHQSFAAIIQAFLFSFGLK